MWFYILKNKAMKITYSILTLVLVTTIFACSKEKQSQGGNSGNGQPGNEVPKSNHPSLKAFFAATAAKPEQHTVDATQFIQITSDEGTSFAIPPNSLVDMMGNPVTGNVDIKIFEFNTPEAMILNNVGTVLASGDLLESGGMFNLEVSQNGQPLRMKDGSGFAVEFPNNQPGMQGYIGTKGTDGTTQWVRRPDWTVQGDSGFMKQFMSVDSFSFTNLDRIADMTNRTDLGVKLHASQANETEVSVSLIFNSRRIMAYVPKASAGLHHTGGYDVPLGESVTLVAYAFIDGYLYWFDKEIIIGDAETIQLPEMEKISEEDFKKRLKALEL